jgi:hypothetical protein
LTLKYDEPLSNFAFNFNLRPCKKGAELQILLSATTSKPRW